MTKQQCGYFYFLVPFLWFQRYGLLLFLALLYVLWKRIPEKGIQDAEKNQVKILLGVILFSNMSGEFATYGPVLAVQIVLLLSLLLPALEQASQKKLIFNSTNRLI